jgi:hypothetical protein
MASTYVNDLRLNEMATGDASGSWGTVTNTNLELIGEAFSYGTETIGDADSTLTIADGAADAARSFYLKITSSVDLTTTRIVTLGPNTVSKVWMIENATTGSQVITIKQGSGATINVPNGQVKMLATDGAGSGGAVLDLLVDVDLTGTTTLVNLDVSGTLGVTGVLTATSLDISGDIDVDGTTNLDVVDIDGATQIDATVTVGVDDTGYDVKFFGATTGKSLLWDESADSLIVTGSTSLQGGLEVGVDDTGYDVKFFGATAGAYMLWDESADDLILGGAAGLSVNSTALVTGVLTTTAATVFNGGFAAGGVGTFADGSNSAPSLTNTGDLNTGLYFPAADEVGLTVGGTQRLNVSATGIDVTGTVVADGQITSARGATTGTYGFRHEGAGKYFRMGVPNASFAYFETDSTGGFSFEGNTIFRGAGTFNEPGNDLDFRVESDTNTHALFVQGSDGFVGIGTSSPAHKLTVSSAAGNGIDAYIAVLTGGSGGTSANQELGIYFGSTNQSIRSNYDGTGAARNNLIFATGGADRVIINSSGGLTTIPAAGGHAVFNEDSADADFRVESDNNAHMLFVDGGANAVGIGTSGPLTTLDISGALRLGGTAEGDQGTQLNLYSDAAGNGYIAVYQLAINTGANDSRTQALLINSSGDVTIAGALSKGSGSFRIPHPLKPETHELVHSFIEGPQADNIYRGKVTLVDGSATVNIDTVSGMSEGTYVLLNTNTQCFTSNESGWTAVKGSVAGNILTIEAQESCSDTISWMVVGERHDQHMLDTKWTDENGKVIVEPLKELES